MRRRIPREPSAAARQLAAISTPEAGALLAMLRDTGDDPEVAELLLELART
jgi:hypothetical protein